MYVIVNFTQYEGQTITVPLLLSPNLPPSNVYYLPQLSPQNIVGGSSKSSPLLPSCIRSKASEPPPTRRLQDRRGPTPPSIFLRLFPPILSTKFKTPAGSITIP